MNQKILILYYSYTNNTKQIAEMIQNELNADIVRVDTIIPYSNNYDVVVEQGQEEVNKNYQPEIKKIEKNLDEYDTIVLGTPVWWYTFAPAILTFLSQNKLEGKTVYPFITNGGWIGHTVKDIQKLCPNAKIENAINIKFSGNKLETSQKEIKEWIDQIK